MTLPALRDMQQDFRAVLYQLEHARKVLGVIPGVNSRNLSIAITRMETALLWLDQALTEREMDGRPEESVSDPTTDDAHIIIGNAMGKVETFRPKLRSEYETGSRDKWYRHAILNTYDHLTVAKKRMQMQLQHL